MRDEKETIQLCSPCIEASHVVEVFDDVGEATVREIGAGREGEESRPICRARAKNWKAREGGSGKDRGRAPYLDSVSLFLFEPL